MSALPAGILLANEILSASSAVLTLMQQIQTSGAIMQKMQAEGRDPNAEEWAQLDAAKKAAADALAAHIAALG